MDAMEIPDPVELGEARAELLSDRISWDGVKRCSMYTCSCGKTVPIEQAEILSADPYGEPFCPSCCEAARKDKQP